MTNEANANMKKRQMLEALDYIDDDIISGVLKKIKPDIAVAADPVQTWKTPFKYWKQFVALAACVVLLSVASPLAGYISQVISNFRAGAGSTSGQEITDDSEAMETETEDFLYGNYLNPIKGLEPLPKGLFSDSFLYYLNIGNSGSDRYLGCFNGYYVIFNVVTNGSNTDGYIPDIIKTYKIAGYEFFYYQSFGMNVYKDGEWFDLQDVYESGLINDEQMHTIYLRNVEYMEYFDPNVNTLIKEAITDDDLALINVAWEEKFGEGEKYAETLNDTRYYIENYCFGKIGENIVFRSNKVVDYTEIYFEIDGVRFMQSSLPEFWVYRNGKLYNLQEAYELGFLTREELQGIAGLNDMV